MLQACYFSRPPFSREGNECATRRPSHDGNATCRRPASRAFPAEIFGIDPRGRKFLPETLKNGQNIDHFCRKRAASTLAAENFCRKCPKMGQHIDHFCRKRVAATLAAANFRRKWPSPQYKTGLQGRNRPAANVAGGQQTTDFMAARLAAVKKIVFF